MKVTRKAVPCEFCEGRGWNQAPYDVEDAFNCPHCNGRGVRVVEDEPKPIELKNESMEVSQWNMKQENLNVHVVKAQG